MSSKVRMIPSNTHQIMKHVVIYARVSSNSMEQLDSLKAQISGLTKFVSGHNNWKLVGVAVVNAGGEEGHIYKLNNSHPAIISKETFNAVQEEKLKRSNIVADENGIYRKNTKYSSVKK